MDVQKPPPSPNDAADHAALLQNMIQELVPLPEDVRSRLIETVITFFGINLPRLDSAIQSANVSMSRPVNTNFQFTAEEPSPKQFILEKAPQTDVERVACLAYYLARYRGLQHFKTKDISALNTESAHRAFANSANAVNNATKMGYLVPSVKGSKQISAAGEKFVEALPDRELADEVFRGLRFKRNSLPRKKAGKKRALET